MQSKITLKDWLWSEWASLPSSHAIAARLSKWSPEVENLCRGEHEDWDHSPSCKQRSENEIYRENAAAIAFVLLEKFIGVSNAGGSNLGPWGPCIDLKGILVTLQINQASDDDLFQDLEKFMGWTDVDSQEVECAIEGVEIVLAEERCGSLCSLGEVFFTLFTRQNPPDWLARQTHKKELEKMQPDEDHFEASMMKALSVLDPKLKSDLTPCLDDGGLFIQKSKQQRQVKSSTFSKISEQYPSLPTSICRLISDLIGSPGCRMNETKAYFASLDVVLDDLKQMVVEPDTFLHDPLTIPVKIDFGTRLYGRKAEIAHILHITDRITSDASKKDLDIINIAGYPGSGKSALIRQVGNYLSKKGWFFLQGKFDRMRLNDTLSVVISTFETFCTTILAMRNTGDQEDLEYCSQVSSAIMQTLGYSGVDYLSFLIPSLPQLIRTNHGEAPMPKPNAEVNSSSSWYQLTKSNTMQSSKEAIMHQHRLGYLFSSFVDAILALGRPMLLFYDDLQWADAATIDFLGNFVKNLANQGHSRKNILIVQSFRDNEVDKAHPIHCEICRVASHESVNFTQLNLGGFSKEDLNDILSTVLRLPHRMTLELSSVIHNKTRGNAMFFIEFVKTLVGSDNKMMTFSLPKRRWVWDVDSIAFLSISADVAGLLTNNLRCIEKKVLDCLIIASFFGSQVSSEVIQLLEGFEGLTNIVESLDFASDQGLLEKAGPLFMFTHDVIQQTVYEITPEDGRIQKHFEIGKMLISKSAEASQDIIEEIFILAVDHINMCLPKSGEKAALGLMTSQRVVFAKLNLKAGQKAISNKSDFLSAKRYLEAGMTFLPEDHWINHYDLSLQIFEEYANVLFVQRKFENIFPHVNIILEKSKCLEDKIKAHEVLISALFVSGSKKKAADHALSVLDTLGFSFPSSVDPAAVNQVTSSLKEATMGLTCDHVKSLPLMTDKVSLQSMKIMSVALKPCNLAAPTMFPLLTCHMVRLTMKYGLCAESALAFANFGHVQLSSFGNYDDGYRMGKISMEIAHRVYAPNIIAELYLTVYAFLFIWKEPLGAIAEVLQHSIKKGMSVGDHDHALLTKVVLGRQSFLAGHELSSLREKQERLCREMTYDKSSKKFFVSFYPMLGDLCLVSSLIGQPDHDKPSPFTAWAENENVRLERSLESKDVFLTRLVYYHRLVKSFWFRDYDTTLDSCDKYGNCSKAGHVLRVTDIYFVFFGGLTSFVLSRNKNKKDLISRGEKSLSIMKIWDSCSKWNFENKLLLLEAEYEYAKGNNEKAKLAYESSIYSAQNHRFIHEEALGSELFGIFCVETGDVTKGFKMLNEAQSLYEKWGAHKKASSLYPL